MTRAHVVTYRMSHGRLGGEYRGAPILLLHHTGAKSGQSRVTPLVYLADDGRYVVFASKAGAPTNPDWYHNLKAHPDVTFEIGDETIDAVTSEATGEERDRLFRSQAALSPQFGEYEKKAGRVIPVMVLTPAQSG